MAARAAVGESAQVCSAIGRYNKRSWQNPDSAGTPDVDRNRSEKQAVEHTEGTVACAGGPSNADRSRPGKPADKARLERIKKEIEDGSYESEGKLRIAISRLLDAVLGGRRKDDGDGEKGDSGAV
jgi:anti-sigma28 factor (negative regulator of flagellin synthesis)